MILPVKRLSLLFAIGPSSVALAQSSTGTLSYAPLAATAPTPVPIGGAGALIATGLLLAVGAAWALRRGGKPYHLSVVALLAVAALAATGSGVHFIRHAWASAPIVLDDPAGGSVTVPVGYAEYQNTSGVPLRITAITPPSCVGEATGTETSVNSAVSAVPTCSAGDTILQDQQRCSTDYCADNEPPVISGPDELEAIMGPEGGFRTVTVMFSASHTCVDAEDGNLTIEPASQNYAGPPRTVTETLRCEDSQGAAVTKGVEVSIDCAEDRFWSTTTQGCELI